MKKLSNERLEVLNAERVKLGLDRIVSLLNAEEAELYKGNIQEARERATKYMAKYENKNSAMYKMQVDVLERMDSLEGELLAHIEKLKSESQVENKAEVEIFENAKIKELDSSLVKALTKVSKIENTIKRHHKQLEKKVASIAKEYGVEIDYSKVDFSVEYNYVFKNEINHIENLKWIDGKSTPYYWELCEIVRKLEDIHSSTSKLEEAKKVVNNWREKKDKAIQERRKIVELNKNVPDVITQYVDTWGEYVKEWHIKRGTKIANLDDVIKEEKEFKVAELVSMVMDVVGVITDAKGLTIGEKGQLNGYIIGTHGKAKVQTIDAGGYNIQKYHFRTLVNKI